MTAVTLKSPKIFLLAVWDEATISKLFRASKKGSFFYLIEPSDSITWASNMSPETSLSSKYIVITYSNIFMISWRRSTIFYSWLAVFIFWWKTAITCATILSRILKWWLPVSPCVIALLLFFCSLHLSNVNTLTLTLLSKILLLKGFNSDLSTISASPCFTMLSKTSGSPTKQLPRSPREYNKMSGCH